MTISQEVNTRHVCVCARVFADLLTEEKREQRKQVKRRTGVEEMMMGKVARTTVSWFRSLVRGSGTSAGWCARVYQGARRRESQTNIAGYETTGGELRDVSSHSADRWHATMLVDEEAAVDKCDAWR
jgi:hypothetical protein